MYSITRGNETVDVSSLLAAFAALKKIPAKERDSIKIYCDGRYLCKGSSLTVSP